MKKNRREKKTQRKGVVGPSKKFAIQISAENGWKTHFDQLIYIIKVKKNIINLKFKNFNFINFKNL